MNRFDPKHYVPILRWKQAERTALARMYENDSGHLTPMIEIVRENLVRKDPKGKIVNLSIGVTNNSILTLDSCLLVTFPLAGIISLRC
jgi:hypothetical protein